MMNNLMLVILLAISTTQSTCDLKYYHTLDGEKHLYEMPPSEDTENIYCVVHDVIEKVYRLTPNIQDVEGDNQNIVHQVYEKLNDIDKETMKFANKLGDFEESGYVLKVNIANNGEFEEVIYFIVPQENAPQEYK